MEESVAPEIIRSKRRTMSLHVMPDARLVVRAPRYVPEWEIRRFIQDKLDWILKKQKQARETYRPPVERRFASGEEILFRGERIPLAVAPGLRLRLELRDGAFHLRENAAPKARRLFLAWFRERAAEVIAQRVERFNAGTGYRVNRIRINSAKSRWGSCSRMGNLNFNWRLILAPPEVLDYVVCHELAHLPHPDHSPRFWARVGEFMPGFAEARGWLKKNHSELQF